MTPTAPVRTAGDSTTQPFRTGTTAWPRTLWHDGGVTPARFRWIALGLKNAEERAHHGHPDFRVGGRIFATLGYPDTKWGMVNLSPDQQRRFLRDHPGAFAPAAGAWGVQGSTTVRLDEADEETVGEALTLAWRNAVEKGPTRSAPFRATRRDALNQEP